MLPIPLLSFFIGFLSLISLIQVVKPQPAEKLSEKTSHSLPEFFIDPTQRSIVLSVLAIHFRITWGSTNKAKDEVVQNAKTFISNLLNLINQKFKIQEEFFDTSTEKFFLIIINNFIPGEKADSEKSHEFIILRRMKEFYEKYFHSSNFVNKEKSHLAETFHLCNRIIENKIEERESLLNDFTSLMFLIMKSYTDYNPIALLQDELDYYQAYWGIDKFREHAILEYIYALFSKIFKFVNSNDRQNTKILFSKFQSYSTLIFNKDDYSKILHIWKFPLLSPQTDNFVEKMAGFNNWKKAKLDSKFYEDYCEIEDDNKSLFQAIQDILNSVNSADIEKNRRTIDIIVYLIMFQEFGKFYHLPMHIHNRMFYIDPKLHDELETLTKKLKIPEIEKEKKAKVDAEQVPAQEDKEPNPDPDIDKTPPENSYFKTKWIKIRKRMSKEWSKTWPGGRIFIKKALLYLFGIVVIVVVSVVGAVGTLWGSWIFHENTEDGQFFNRTHADSNQSNQSLATTFNPEDSDNGAQLPLYILLLICVVVLLVALGYHIWPGSARRHHTTTPQRKEKRDKRKNKGREKARGRKPRHR